MGADTRSSERNRKIVSVNHLMNHFAAVFGLTDHQQVCVYERVIIAVKVHTQTQTH